MLCRKPLQRALALAIATTTGPMLAGCSDETTNTDENDGDKGTDGGEPSGNDGGDGIDGGGPGDGSTDGATAFGEPAKWGVARVVQRHDTKQTYNATAAFRTGSCETMTEGNCSVRNCLADRDYSDAGAISDPPHAGDIDITGGSTDLALSPKSDGTYDPVSDKTLLWNGTIGEIGFDASGGDVVGSFSDTLTPEHAGLSVIRPNLRGDARTLDVDTSADISVEWESKDVFEGNQTIFRLAHRTDRKSIVTTCAWPAMENEQTVPASVLQPFPEGAGTFMAAIGDISQQEVGDWTLQISVVQMGNEDEMDERRFRGDAMFE